MGVTRLSRKQLAEQLRHNDTAKIRVAIQRGNLVETKNKFIEIDNESNYNWLDNQIKLARHRGLVVDINLKEPAIPINTALDEERNAEEVHTKGSGGGRGQVDTDLKKARTELVREQTKTAQLNREIALGNYLRTSHMVEALTVYLDQTMNVANTNISNAVSRICIRHGIKSAEEVVKIKSELTDALNMAIADGRVEVMNMIERMVLEQVEKLAKK